jgi:phosphate:Na+ symporter
MALLNIAGGVALILFGIRFLRKGLERLFGRELYEWIERKGQRPWMAAFVGLAFGAVAPSSTAQTLVALQLLRVGKLPAQAALGFLLGANLGITITVQLIALRIFEYYSLFIVVGLICFLGFKAEKIRGMGQSCLGLGLVFLGMTVTTQGATVVAGNSDFITILGVLVRYKLFTVIFAALLTFVMQSSTATIGLSLAIAGTGAMNLNLVLPVILGTNLGIGLTSLVAGFQTWDGRRLAGANLLLKTAAVILALAGFPLIESWVAASPGGIVHQAANFHTGFNVLVAVFGVVLAHPVGKLMEKAVKPSPVAVDPSRPLTHLDPGALATPAFALANATRETLRLADTTKTMLESAWIAVLSQDAKTAALTQKQDDRIDELNANIKAYLSQIPGEALTPADQQLQFGLLNFSSQLESIADVIDKSLCGSVIEHAHEVMRLQTEDQADLEELYRRVIRRVDTAISVLATRDRTLAQQFLDESEQLKEWSIQVQKRHYARLTADNPVALKSSTRFLDTFNVLRRISGQLNTIGHTFVTA